MKGRESILGVSGMAEEGVICGVKVWRPLLVYTKKYIFEFAHKYGVPYFLDTTPKWSNRGKMRNELMPLLSDMFGAGYLKNISAMGQDSTELHEITSKYVFGPFWKTLQVAQVGCSINVNDHRNESRLFWKETLRYIFHSVLGTSTVRDKSMTHFMKRLAFGTNDEQGLWVSLKKENPSLLLGDFLIIFKENFFVRDQRAWTPKQTFQVGKKDFLHPTGDSKWTVSVEVCPVSEKVQNEFTIWDILSGKLTYYLPFADGYYIDSFSRIKPFRAISPFISEDIPIIVTADNSLLDEQKCVRVSLVWESIIENSKDVEGLNVLGKVDEKIQEKNRMLEEGNRSRKEKKGKQRELQEIRIKKIIEQNKLNQTEDDKKDNDDNNVDFDFF